MKRGQIRIKPKHRDEINLDQIVTALFLHSVHGETSAETSPTEPEPSPTKSPHAGGGDGDAA